MCVQSFLYCCCTSSVFSFSSFAFNEVSRETESLHEKNKLIPETKSRASMGERKKVVGGAYLINIFRLFTSSFAFGLRCFPCTDFLRVCASKSASPESKILARR